MENSYFIIEVQVNDGTPASPAVVIKDNLDDAQGEMWVKLGYAYQHPRDYTAVVIFDMDGYLPVAPVVIDKRDEAERVPVFFLSEIQVNGSSPVAIPVNIQVGDNAESLIMQAYHNSLSYAWNVKRPYTLCYASYVLNKAVIEKVDFLPVENEQEENN